MNQQEICEIIEMLNDARKTKNWDIIDDLLLYIKDYCPDYDNDNEDE